MDFKSILNDIKNKIFAPVYFFYGDEPFFIDQLTRYIEQNALDESVKDFNQSVVYGRDSSGRDVVDLARRFPMFGNYHLVIVKEAQDLKDIEVLEPYLEAPSASTILVISFKYKKPDGRKSVFKKLIKNPNFISFESKKLYDNQVPGWIEKAVAELHCSIQPHAVQMLADYIGNDLSRINNELDKLMISTKQGELITAEKVEDNIGISKDYNIFEFQKALVQRDALKAYRIVQYFEANPKENPLQMMTVILHNFFIKVLICNELSNLTDNKLAGEIGVSPVFVKDYRQAARIFSPVKVKSIISEIRKIDLRSKGVGTVDSNSYGTLQELVYKVVH
ncbi:MAG TPA: DNA polymerase III subunit delta [Bacteroidales bacterium]